MAFHRSSLLIRKSFLTNVLSNWLLIRKSFLTKALSNCGLFTSLFQLSLAIFPSCLCIVRKPAVFSIWSYHLSPFSQRDYCSIPKKSRAILLYFWKCIKINKRCQTISWYNLFPAWECKQTWLPRNFVSIIDLLVSSFPRMKSANKHYVICLKMTLIYSMYETLLLFLLDFFFIYFS